MPWLVCPLGVASCLILLAPIFTNWINVALMVLWTIVGFAIYFGYGYRHSKLRANPVR
jgi:APA family basic amino acid/polyamine antiporter